MRFQVGSPDRQVREVSAPRLRVSFAWLPILLEQKLWLNQPTFHEGGLSVALKSSRPEHFLISPDFQQVVLKMTSVEVSNLLGWTPRPDQTDLIVRQTKAEAAAKEVRL